GSSHAAYSIVLPCTGAGAGAQDRSRTAIAPVQPRGEVTMRAEVENVIQQLRPTVQLDGGDLELVDVTEEGVVTIRLHGSCSGCNSSTTTLRNGIERYLRYKLPQVTQVHAE